MAKIQSKYGQLAGARHGWFVCTHTDTSYLPQVLESCCDVAIRKDLSPVAISIFLSGTSLHRHAVSDIQQCVKTFLPLPAITIIPQSPAIDQAECSGFAVELLAVSGDIRSPSAILLPNTVQWETPVASFSFVGSQDRAEEDTLPAYQQSLNLFERLQVVLKMADFNVEDIIRTWIYQGTLTAQDVSPIAVSSATATVATVDIPQRYQELNRARSDFFQRRMLMGSLLPDGFLRPAQEVYPASTGIGADGYRVTMNCLAVKPKPVTSTSTSSLSSVCAIPLENPLQTSAFDYAALYSPKSPKFARAIALVDAENCTVFVSGTASITESETQHVGDPVAQTHQTLDNIATLIAGENLRKYGIESHHFDLTDLVVMRVYIKYRSDVAAIRGICELRCAGIPTIFTIADVCRDDLLVEIEGVVAAE